ncbi:hypothetical protein PILCRDRAFT_817359 [Piloderma croceum F 1598]|uniref:Uncharacterized protein n=1 Tax=Piloderma croceum (strain F 1598) TaxID=765440 RepID=A0A0C3G3Z2_PILCF|nr:hypothetical protein PILCRDRAFT_817359 [Piloderma croceum F 1598]
MEHVEFGVGSQLTTKSKPVVVNLTSSSPLRLTTDSDPKIPQLQSSIQSIGLLLLLQSKAIPNTVTKPIGRKMGSKLPFIRRNKLPSPPVSRHIPLYAARPKPTKSIRHKFYDSKSHTKSSLSTPIKTPALNKHSFSNEAQMPNIPRKTRTPADCDRTTLAASIIRALSTPRAINGGPLISASRLKAKLGSKSRLTPTSKSTPQNLDHSPHAIIP